MRRAFVIFLAHLFGGKIFIFCNFTNYTTEVYEQRYADILKGKTNNPPNQKQVEQQGQVVDVKFSALNSDSKNKKMSLKKNSN